MHYDTLRVLDLNLLITLDVLLRERNVTRTAEKLGVGQPGVSAQLARLRDHFDDELLHRTGRHYELTPLAAQLVAHTGPAIAGIRRVFEVSTTYDPHTSDREFRLLVSDYSAVVLGEVLAKRFAVCAPRVHVRLEQATELTFDTNGELLKTVDGVLLTNGRITGAESLDLFDDEWVCIVSEDNADVGNELTLDHLRELSWVFAHDKAPTVTPAAQQLARLRVKPKVVMVVESFHPVPFLVAGTNRIAMMQRRLAERLAPVAGVRVLTCPRPTEPLTQSLSWHPIFTSEPAHRWFREELRACGEAVSLGQAQTLSAVRDLGISQTQVSHR